MQAGRSVFILAQVGYLVLAAMAVLFFQERLSSDTSYYFFKALNTRWFHVEHQRAVLLFAEWPVVLLSWFGVSLKVLAVAYSLGHVLFFYAIGWYSYRRYRTVFAWLLLLLLQLVGIREGFIGPIFEQFYGTALAVLFFQHLPDVRGWKGLAFSVLLFVLVISSHPFNIILALFLLALDFIRTHSSRRYLPYAVILFLFLLYKSAVASEYESGKMKWIFDLKHNKTYALLFDAAQLRARALFLVQYYAEVLLALFLLTLFWWRQKEYLRLALLWTFFTGALLLINFSYAITEYSRYNEQVYYLLVPLVLIPLLLFAFPAWEKKNLLPVMALLPLLITWRFYLQANTAIGFRSKTELARTWVRQAQQQEGCCFYLTPKAWLGKERFVDWDMGFFTLYLSAAEAYAKQVTILPVEDDTAAVLALPPEQWWFRGGEAEARVGLNMRYFALCNAGYQPLRP